MKYKIISTDFYIADKNIKNISLKEEDSFLDGDIVLINPTEWYNKCISHSYERIPQILRKDDSLDIKKTFERRQEEIKTLLSSKKVVIVFLNTFHSFQLEYEYKKYSTYSNYSFLPYPLSNITSDISNGSGENIYLQNTRSPFTSYYHAFKDTINYRSYLTRTLEDDAQTFFTNKTNNTIGFSTPYEKGLFVMLPYPQSIKDPL